MSHSRWKVSLEHNGAAFLHFLSDVSSSSRASLCPVGYVCLCCVCGLVWAGVCVCVGA